MDTHKQIEKLRAYYGNYSAVARVLGITPRHFRNIRNKKTGPSMPLLNLIEAKASTLATNKSAA